MTFEEVLTLKPGDTVIAVDDHVKTEFGSMRGIDLYKRHIVSRHEGTIIDLKWDPPSFASDLDSDILINEMEFGRHFILPDAGELYSGDFAVLINTDHKYDSLCGDNAFIFIRVMSNNMNASKVLSISAIEDNNFIVKYSDKISVNPTVIYSDGSCSIEYGIEFNVDKSDLFALGENKPIGSIKPKAGDWIKTDTFGRGVILQIIKNIDPDTHAETVEYIVKTNGIKTLRTNSDFISYYEPEYQVGNVIELKNGWSFIVINMTDVDFSKCPGSQYSYKLLGVNTNNTSERVRLVKSVDDINMNNLYAYLCRLDDDEFVPYTKYFHYKDFIGPTE